MMFCRSGIISILACLILVHFFSFSVVAGEKPTPDKCLQMLKEGNKRFSSGKPVHPHTDRLRLEKSVKEGQASHEFATVITCSDSRVPVEILFDAGIMDIFVIRVAGNVCDTDEIASIEYGLAHVNTPVLVVLGHTDCGAVTATVQGFKGTGKPLETNISLLLDKIKPAVKIAASEHPEASVKELIPYAIEQNVYKGIENLFLKSPVSRKLVEAKKVKVIGAIYDIGNGSIRWLPEKNTLDILARANKNQNCTLQSDEKPKNK